MDGWLAGWMDELMNGCRSAKGADGRDAVGDSSHVSKQIVASKNRPPVNVYSNSGRCSRRPPNVGLPPAIMCARFSTRPAGQASERCLASFSQGSCCGTLNPLWRPWPEIQHVPPFLPHEKVVSNYYVHDRYIVIVKGYLQTATHFVHHLQALVQYQ